MQEHHVNVADVQLFQRLINGFCGMIILVRIQLCLHKDFFPRYTGFADAFAHLPFISIEGRITNAANFLHVTQPTLSRQIRDLEEELGQKLFTRGSHNMTLTAEGMILRKRAEEIISMVDKTEAEFNSMENVIGGDIYIGGGETKAIRLVAEIAHDLRQDYPGIHYHLYSGSSEDVTGRLDKGLLDFGILIQPADISKYDYINIPARDIWGVVMRKDSPLAQKDTIRREDLLGVPLICSRQAISADRRNNEFAEWLVV